MRKLTDDRWKSPKGDVGKTLRRDYLDMDGDRRPCWVVGVIVADGPKFWTVEIAPGNYHYLHERPDDHPMGEPFRIRVAKDGGRRSRFAYDNLHVDKCKYCVAADVDAEGIRCVEHVQSVTD